MLSKLFIQNYAIISTLEIDFAPNLSIITGETGAGKSILMGALGLALGDRADLSQLRDKEKKLVVEASFQVKKTKSLSALFDAADIDLDSEVILRREVAANGKSRSFINDTPVTLSQLNQVSGLLVDLHQQFDTLELGSKEFQTDLLDARAGALDLMESYSTHFSDYQRVLKTIAGIKERIAKAEQEREYKLFLLTELDELNWQEGEAKQLEEELNILSHADQIRSGLARVSNALDEGEQPVLAQLKSLLSQLQSLSPYHADLSSYAERMSSAYLELKDLSSDVNALSDKIQVDEKRMDELNARISQSQRLVKKHGVVDADALVALRTQLSADAASFESMHEELEAAEKQLATLHATCLAIAKDVQQKRTKQIPSLEKDSKELLSRIGMPNAVLKIDVKPSAQLISSGLDEVQFLFDANKSGQFEPLHKVASGGELSRLMLVLKSLVADSLDMPTMIFDEIDSGISGEAARQVGVLMEELAASHQVISITHQPQIAARAHHHLYVYKQEVNGVINTSIRSLSLDERVNAIAHMLAGENPSEAVLASAREMIK